jgi:chromosome partitioning protein
MIVARLNRKGGVGKTTLALHLAGAWAGQGKRVVVIDADPQGSALDWSAQRAKEAVPRLFGIIGLARDTLHREAPELARDADHVVIDGPPRVASLLAARTVIARETADGLADYDPPVLASRIGQRVAFADTARTGRFVFDIDTARHAVREIIALAAEVDRVMR